MKKLLLLLISVMATLTSQHAFAQCNAAFEWEQLPNSLSIHFINHSTSEHDIISNIWNFGDGHTGDGQNPTHTYAEPGVYLVCLIIEDNEGCQADVCHEVVVEANGDNCEAFFEFEINQSTQTVHFFDGSESDHDIATWIWNFGDGHTGDGQNPIHTYEDPGTYEVCLTIVSETGCEDTYCHAVIIEGGDPGGCEAFFEVEINHETYTVHFFDGSDSDHDIASWIWDFGDNSSGDGQNPIHHYDEPGTYLVCLTIVSETGCEDSYCHEITIEESGDNCEAFFEVEINHETNTVHFFDGSTSEHDISHWIWHFGDGHTGDGQNPVHTYAHDGTYEVCLTIISETGCEDTYCHAVIIGNGGDGCEAFFEVEINHETNTVHFFDGSSSEHDIAQWIWNFGDGHVGDGQNPVHVYEHDGTYEVCLTIVSETGCEDIYCHPVVIGNGGDGCVAFFEFEINHETNTVHFFDGSTSEHDIVQWHWNFGDGQLGDGQNPIHTYNHSGTYEVCLVIVSETGCEDSYCHHVVIEGEGNDCEAHFNFETNQETHTVHFFDNSTSEHDIVQWIWHFGDGQVDSVQNPVHTYGAPGTYEVCLIIVDETGCEDQYCHHVVIHEPEPICDASFYWVYNIITDSLEFHNTSDGATPHTTWLWTFGDGNTSTEENPQHEYEEGGSYTICLIMTDTTTDCSSDVCHTYFQEIPAEENNEQPENEEPPASFTDGPVIRYTNPVSDNLNLTYWAAKEGIARLQLLTMTGNEIATYDLGKHERGLFNTTLTIPGVEPGMYLIELTINSDRLIRQVMIIQ